MAGGYESEQQMTQQYFEKTLTNIVENMSEMIWDDVWGDFRYLNLS